MSEKLIVFFHDANDRYGLEDGFVLHASGKHFEQIRPRGLLRRLDAGRVRSRADTDGNGPEAEGE